MSPDPSIRKECPPGVCDCERERLLTTAGADRRILLLTRAQEQALCERLERADSLQDLEHVQRRMYEQLGLRLRVAPGFNEVRTARGFEIELLPQPGLCRRTRQAVPAAVRRCLDRHPHVAWAILNANDLLRDA